MEIQGMTDYLTLPKKFSLQQIILHRLAKKYWGDFVLRKSLYVERISIPRETEKLVAHRKTVLHNLPQISNDLPRLLKDKLVNAVFSLQQGYREALIWEKKCALLPFTILNPMTAGEYQAGCFIDPSGHFNDLVWAKRYVSGEKQFVKSRFLLACVYCFEESILELWHTMKINRQLPFGGNLARIQTIFGYLVWFWVFQLENNFDELIEENSDYVDVFYFLGLKEAIFRGHEYAARYLWKRCSDHEKAKFLREPEFHFFSDAAENNHAGLVSFIYSLLPLEQKNNLISWTIQNNRPPWIWCCLLQSQYYECVLNDILNCSYTIPTRMYECILNSLTHEMKRLQMPAHETIFKFLWNHLPQAKRKEILEIDSYVIMNLVKIKAMDLLKIVIQPLSHSEKDKMLLYDWQYGGKSALDEFSKVGDYDALQRYLLFFLIDSNAITQKLSLRTDAFSFLDNFIKGEFFISWTKKQIPESQEKEVNKVIENLQDSLKVLDLLLEQLELERNRRHCYS